MCIVYAYRYTPHMYTICCFEFVSVGLYLLNPGYRLRDFWLDGEKHDTDTALPKLPKPICVHDHGMLRMQNSV